LKKNLIQIEKERKIQSLRRSSEFRVSLVGYTNAGKSTLFKALTGSDVFIKNQLFATLDTTIRQLSIDSNHSILLSDTVGFIRKLPHNLVASFRSTLKEVVESNLILMVLDVSSDYLKDHIGVIKEVLDGLGAKNIPLIYVLNKVDLITDNEKLNTIVRDFDNSVIISAKRHLMLSKLKEAIIEKMEKDYQTFNIKLSYSEGKAIAQIKNTLEILEEEYEEDLIRMKIRGSKIALEKASIFNFLNNG
jgi:GTP-binding protein HflX